MFPLIQRCYFCTPFKLQKLTGPQLLLYGKNKTTWSSLRLWLQKDICPLSRSPSLNPVSLHATRLQGFHTSLPFFKKKTSKESESKNSGVLRRSMQALKDSPKPALYLSLAGLIPFVSVPLLMAIQGTYHPELAFAQVTYGAATVSFLGGMRWGFALPEDSPAKPDWLNLANSTIPLLFAWQALLFKDITSGAVMLVMALGVALHYDLALLPTYPRWFKVLRVVGTLVMVFSLLATALLKTISEMEQSNSTNKWQNTK
ncbi:transmembrane protein 69 [Colius striatus]|uniref:transmembrane protein 69 n=1 Tax=Colius striatus TaxID=57412 RepID=UPI002B1D987E|nr:transmembrane protein 69 [Colius striatus]XP_061859285.1 transmembrane protein 69 [Colius striatus]XP_061859286.1 transmembrane protein 69 [Colius striatus]XP_061859287.1 transmembrane protein 69 [Colius striatus]